MNSQDLQETSGETDLQPAVLVLFLFNAVYM